MTWLMEDSLNEKEELKKTLDREKIDPRYYSLNGLDDPNYYDRLILDNQNNQWLVYYYERGTKDDIRVFPTEEEACRYILQLLIRDTNNRIYNQNYKR